MGKYNYRILYITRPYENYESASYQRDFIDAFRSTSNTDVYVIPQEFERHENVQTTHMGPQLQKALRNYDIAILGHHFLGDSKSKNIAPLMCEFLECVNIPKIAFLNKDYNRLGDKLKIFETIGVDGYIVHTKTLLESANEHNLDQSKIHFSPFGVNTTNIPALTLSAAKRKYSFSFSGIVSNHLHMCDYQLIRQKIQSSLYRDFLSFRFKRRVSGPSFYWNGYSSNEGRVRRFINRYKRLATSEYFRILSESEMVLCTPSMRHITPRYFEALAVGALPLSPWFQDFKDLPGMSSVLKTFSEFDDFFRIISEYVPTYSEREVARHWVYDTSTYEHRVRKINEFLCQLK